MIVESAADIDKSYCFSDPVNVVNDTTITSLGNQTLSLQSTVLLESVWFCLFTENFSLILNEMTDVSVSVKSVL